MTEPPLDEASPSSVLRERRLAAVAFLDVVDYSRMIGADEEGTIEHWTELRTKVIEPLVAGCRGRIVERRGDSVLVEFQNVVDATKWALDVQAQLAEPERHHARGELMQARIAIHFCDVIVQGNEILGDGVNIAARLQEHAPPGGIAMSSAVHEQVRHMLVYEVEDLGPLFLKNIQRPIRAFAVPGTGPAEARRPAALPSHRPSVAVLPLRNLGPNAIEPYFIDGLVHEVVACLSAFRELFVLSSNSTVRVTRKDLAKAPNIGRLLGVRYLLSGTVSHQGDLLHISVELSDVETDSPVWLDRYKASVGDLVAAQEAAATRIAFSLLPHLRGSELRRAMRKPPASMDAYDLVLQALHRLYSFDEADDAKAQTLLLRAVERDPTYAMAYALLAHLCLFRVAEERSLDLTKDRQEAVRYSSHALELDASDPIALAIHGHLLAFLFADYDRALDAFDRALASSPNSPIAWGMSSPTYAYLGDGATAVARAEGALRLSPLDPYAHVFYGHLGLAHYINGTYEDAVRADRRALGASPGYVAVLRHMTASLVALGRLNEARETAGRLLVLRPGFRVRTFIAGYPIKDPDRAAAFSAQLLAAGLPP